MSDSRINSLCAFYADILERQIKSEDPDMDVIEDMLQHIRENCQTVGYKKGETPEHLEEYLYD